MNLDEVIPLLLAACPSAKSAWDDHLQFWGQEAAGSFNDVAVFAHHVVDSYAAGKTMEFAAFFEVLERMIREGDSQVAELATVGLIEDIQNVASHRQFGYHVFESWLATASRREWANIESIWAGKNSLMDVLRAEAETKRGRR